MTKGWKPGGMECEEVRALVHRWLAGDLPRGTRGKVERHLRACGHCFSRFEFARLLRRVTRERFAAPRAPAGLARSLARRLA